MLRLKRNFIPRVACGRNREKPRQEVVRGAGDEESREIIDVVDVRGALRHIDTDRTHESNDVDQKTTDIRRISSPGNTAVAIIRTVGASVVQVFDVEIALAHQVVVANHRAGNGGEENRVGGKVDSELVGRGHKMPLHRLATS